MKVLLIKIGLNLTIPPSQNKEKSLNVIPSQQPPLMKSSTEGSHPEKNAKYSQGNPTI